MKQRMFHGGPSRVRGIGLVELLVSVAIGMVVVAGIAVAYASMRSTLSAANASAQLQDDQRMAASLLAGVVQHAGYYWNPGAQTVQGAFPKDEVFATAGQFVAGVAATATSPERLIVRFVGSPAGAPDSDSLHNCNGFGNSNAGSAQSFTNQFTVNAAGELTCSVNGGAAMPLVGNLAGWSVLYGLDTDGDGTVDQYATAKTIAAADWTNVVEIAVTLSFANTLSPGKPPIKIKRVIALYNAGL